MKKNEVNKKKIEKDFIEKFKIPKDFYDFKKLGDGSGFMVRKKLNQKDEYSSLVRISLKESEKEKMPFELEMYYCDEKENPPKSSKKFNIPVNIESLEDYFYNYKKKEFYRKNKKVSSEKIIEEFYESHIKTTKFFKGFWLRTKLFFWRKFVPLISGFIADRLTGLLYLISGDRYKYSYSSFGEEEKLNGKIIGGHYFGKEIANGLYLGRDVNSKEVRQDEKSQEAENPINFYGYIVSRRTMGFYSFLHLVIYFIFFVKPEARPDWLSTIFKNIFLTINYAIVSLGLLDVGLPAGFKFFIRKLAKESFDSRSRKIKI